VDFPFFKKYLENNYSSISKPYILKLIEYYDDLYKYQLSYNEKNKKVYYYGTILNITIGIISILLIIINIIITIK